MSGILFLGFFFLLLIAGVETLMQIFRKGTIQAAEERERDGSIGDLGAFILLLVFFSLAVKVFNANVYMPSSKWGIFLQGIALIGATIYATKRMRLF